MKAKNIIYILLFFICTSVSCFKKGQIPIPELIVEDIVVSDCGANKGNLIIDNIAYCSAFQECTASLKTKSPCGNDGVSNKLVFWFFFRDIKIDGQSFNEVWLKGVLNNVTKTGKYAFDVTKDGYDYSSFSTWDENKKLNLNFGTVNIVDLTNNKFSATYSINIKFAGKNIDLKGNLSEIKLDFK